MFKAFYVAAWNLVKPILKVWLPTRAFVIPDAELTILANKYKVDKAIAKAIEDAILAEIPALLDQFKP